MNPRPILLAKPVSTEDVVHAIELRCSPVLGALNMANALGGAQTDVWRLVREFSLVQLIDEADERGIDFTTLKAALCDVPVIDTPPFRHAVGYDPRPRCGLCNRRHNRKRHGEAMSCGVRFEDMPEQQWSKPSAIAAFEGQYQPAEKRS